MGGVWRVAFHNCPSKVFFGGFCFNCFLRWRLGKDPIGPPNWILGFWRCFVFPSSLRIYGDWKKRMLDTIQGPTLGDASVCFWMGSFGYQGCLVTRLTFIILHCCFLLISRVECFLAKVSCTKVKKKLKRNFSSAFLGAYLDLGTTNKNIRYLHT